MRRWIEHSRSPQIDAVAVLVAQHLNLDMARVFDKLFNEKPIIAKRGCGLRARPVEAFAHLIGIVGDAHALATAAGRCLDHHRIADFLGNAHSIIGGVEDAKIARNSGHPGIRSHLLGRDLVAHRLDGPWIRPDEGDSVFFKQRGEGRAL